MNSRVENNNIILPRYISWCLSGKSCIRNHNGIVNFTIDVTKYSASYERDTCISFNILQNGTVKTSGVFLNVGGTGIYKYTCMNLSGNICLTSTYKCFCRRFGCYNNEPVYKPYYKTLTKSSSYVVNEIKSGHIGYNGNNCIYTADLNGLDNGKGIDTNTCDLFGKYIDLKPKAAEHNFSLYNSDVSYKGFLVGDESYDESDAGCDLSFHFNLTDLGAAIGTYDISSNVPQCLPYTSELITSIKAINQPEAEVELLPRNPSHEIGINVTGDSNKMTTENNDLELLMLNGLSFVPVVGIIPTAASFVITAQNLVKCITSKSLQQSNYGDQPATVTYATCGGKLFRNCQARSCSLKNFYSTGLVGKICMNNQYITEPFTLCISYSSMITPFSEQGATIKDKINFTPATLIYNNSIPSSLSDYTLYLKNENTNTIYKLSKRDTLFGFFVNPSQNYDLYKYIYGKLSLVATINSNDLVMGGEYNVHL